MEGMTLSQWWNVLSEFLWITGCSLFEAVQFMTDKYGEPVEKKVLQDFEESSELD